jgi:hypothetical protein
MRDQRLAHRLVSRTQLPIVPAKHAGKNRIKVCAALENLPLSIKLLKREGTVIATVMRSDVRCVNEQKASVPTLPSTQANDRLIRAMRH